MFMRTGEQKAKPKYTFPLVGFATMEKAFIQAPVMKTADGMADLIHFRKPLIVQIVLVGLLAVACIAIHPDGRLTGGNWGLTSPPRPSM